MESSFTATTTATTLAAIAAVAAGAYVLWGPIYLFNKRQG